MLQFDHTNFKKSNQKFVLICFYLYSLLAGSIHSEVWHLFEETVSKFQIFIYGPRRSGHSALDYYSKSHYYGIRFEILPTKFDQVEFRNFGNERPVWRIRTQLLSLYYEQLILHPRTWLTKILKFLDLPWTEEVMHHEKQINKPHGISLSKVERSSDQVNRFLLKKDLR